METASLTPSSSPSSGSSTSIHTLQRRGPWTRKPLSLVLEEHRREHDSSATARHLSLMDLIAIGVGGTIGSGIFVLTGFIAHHYAGPATFLSFLISGGAAVCSGLSYSELASNIPAAGSTYIYSYITLGEWFAVVAAACLSLEYAVSGAAVARSWGSKVVEWLTVQWQWEAASTLLPGEFFNPMAGLVSLASVALLVYGVEESKFVSNVTTLFKVGLVITMIVGGLCLMNTENLNPVIPYGAAGVLRGATSSFFGYLGYDEVCCIAAEAKNPSRDLPRAVMWTLGLVTVLYVFASIALVGMVPLESIDDTSGFPSAFHTRGLHWVAQVTAAGEVLTLPVVVLISLMAQPRLQLAVAKDGLLPEIFARVDEKGNLKWGCILCGIPMTILASFVPFTFLDDLISAGILVAFCMTNSSLILLRCESPIGQPDLLRNSLGLYHILAFGTGLSFHLDFRLGVVFFVGVAMFCLWIHNHFPPSATFGGSEMRRHLTSAIQESHGMRGAFKAPLVPLLPCVGIFVNWYLISQLEWTGMLFLILYIGLVTVLYLVYCRHFLFNRWWQSDYAALGLGQKGESDRDMIMLREFSMPKRSAIESSNMPQSI